MFYTGAKLRKNLTIIYSLIKKTIINRNNWLVCVLTHDDESHYSFVETTSAEPRKRNKYVYAGDYADNVAREIRNALKGLLEEG